VDLSRVYFILVDERMVSPLDPESNYGMVQRELLTRIVLPPGHIHHIRGEASPETAAHEYEQVLETLFSMFNGRCDLIVLGVGKDGHTASLFPGTRVLRELQHNVQAVLVPHLDSWRVTLTLPVINRSRTVLFLVAGEHKAEIVGRIFASMQSRETIPATLVRPDSGTITWILDAKAAARIPRERLSRKS
jgi:6-phosphogluconolactonase